MDIVEMNTEHKSQQDNTTPDRNALRPRRRIAKQMVERGQRLRNRAGVLIGLSLGIVALLTMLD